jgi:hypothetical protein
LSVGVIERDRNVLPGRLIGDKGAAMGRRGMVSDDDIHPVSLIDGEGYVIFITRMAGAVVLAVDSPP